MMRRIEPMLARPEFKGRLIADLDSDEWHLPRHRNGCGGGPMNDMLIDSTAWKTRLDAEICLAAARFLRV
jgi:hypothetical protein